MSPMPTAKGLRSCHDAKPLLSTACPSLQDLLRWWHASAYDGVLVAGTRYLIGCVIGGLVLLALTTTALLTSGAIALLRHYAAMYVLWTPTEPRKRDSAPGGLASLEVPTLEECVIQLPSMVPCWQAEGASSERAAAPTSAKIDLLRVVAQLHGLFSWIHDTPVCFTLNRSSQWSASLRLPKLFFTTTSVTVKEPLQSTTGPTYTFITLFTLAQLQQY